MELWIDIGFAVLLRLLKDEKQRLKFKAAFLKVTRASIVAFGFSAADVGLE